MTVTELKAGSRSLATPLVCIPAAWDTRLVVI